MVKAFIKKILTRMRGELSTADYVRKGLTVGTNFNKMGGGDNGYFSLLVNFYWQ